MATHHWMKALITNQNMTTVAIKNVFKHKSMTNLQTIENSNFKYILNRSQYASFRTFAGVLTKGTQERNVSSGGGSDTQVEKKAITAINHFKVKSYEYSLPHPIWTDSEAETVDITHRNPQGISDRIAYYSVQFLRKTFDVLSGYTVGKHFQTLDERAVLNRCIFLETVAGVPGFAAAMIRHLHSLRKMKSDHGWIHTLLEEAENERMHLMTFTSMRNPGFFFRGTVIATQWLFTAAFSLGYLISPRFCHRFVGYLEEEAVKTYTHIVGEIDAGRLPMWQKLPAPELAVDYWKLEKDALMRDVILAIRADEAHHRDVNHTLGSLKQSDDNPFPPGY